MVYRLALVLLSLAIATASPAVAQFTGPSLQGQQSSVAAVQSVRIGSYVALEGSVVAHLREDYYLFRDDSGEIRVEISRRAFAGQEVGPDDRVRIMGEVDSGRSGRYVWVKSLQLLR